MSTRDPSVRENAALRRAGPKPPAGTSRPGRKRGSWRLVLIGSVALVVVFAIVLRSMVPNSSEAARGRIVAFLADRLDSDVECQDVSLRLFPELPIEGHGLEIRHKGRRDVPPLISVAHFSAEGSIANLLRKHVTHLTVQGLDIKISGSRNHPSFGVDKGRLLRRRD